jgi:hypothetical protein
LQRYAEWCTANNYPDYSVNKTIKLRAFMDFEISRRGNVAATTKSNLLRNLVPMLERYAQPTAKQAHQSTAKLAKINIDFLLQGG